MAVKNVEADLQQQVEILRQKQKLEQLRADQLGFTKVRAEQDIVASIGASAAKRIMADAFLYEKNSQAEGFKTNLIAYGEGLKNLTAASRGDASLGRFYLALQAKLFEKLAVQQAKAMKDMAPTISVWNTGSSPNKSLALPKEE